MVDRREKRAQEIEHPEMTIQYNVGRITRRLFSMGSHKKDKTFQEQKDTVGERSRA